MRWGNPTSAAAGLHKLKLNLPSNRARSLGQRVQSHRIILRIEQTIQRSAAGVHPPRHVRLAQLLFRHLLTDLPRQNALDRHSCYFFIDIFFTQPVVEAAADVLLLHHSTPFIRFRARSISCCGVFCVFLMKPCNSTMLLLLTQKMIRAILPCVSELRTSQSPRLRGRTSGRPSGHANSTSLMSSPTIRRSSGGSSFSHSRTGSRPPALR